MSISGGRESNEGIAGLVAIVTGVSGLGKRWEGSFGWVMTERGE